VAEKTGKVYVKWIRSGIGFPRRQKNIVKSLGLRRLNQVVERPDTVHIRGLVASVPHLVELVDPPASPAWSSLPEYRILETRPKSVTTAEKAGKATPAEVTVASKDVGSATAAPLEETASSGGEVVSPPKKPRATKARDSESAKEASASSEKGKRGRKAGGAKSEAEEQSKPKKGKK